MSRRQVLERYTHVREDHLRYMQKWGLIRPEKRADDTLYAFQDLAVIKQADEALAEGAKFRSVLKQLRSSRSGQLAFDFRIEAHQAKVLRLQRREPPPMAVLMDSLPPPSASSAEQYFLAASTLDDGDPANFQAAADAYRRALEIDPYLVPAIINLANIHYASDQIPEAQALYERAISLESDIFEAHFNLGNIFHDLGRYAAAQAAYRDALRLNPGVARAHSSLGFLLAEKGETAAALAHWRRAVEIDPRESAKLLALVAMLSQRGRAAEARPYVELFVASAPPALAGEVSRARRWLAEGPAPR